MMRSDAKVDLYSQPVDFLKSIHGLAVLVEQDSKVAIFAPALAVYLSAMAFAIGSSVWSPCDSRHRLMSAPPL